MGVGWSVFVVENDRVLLRTDEGGQRALEAEIVRGLAASEKVIRHSTNRIENGARIEAK